jgi:hypothetical protein
MVIAEFDLGYNKDNIIEVACNGNLDAQEEMVSQYLYDGKFFDDSPDWDKALFWLNKAAQNNSIFSQRCLKRLQENPKDRTFGGMRPTSKKLMLNEEA